MCDNFKNSAAYETGITISLILKGEIYFGDKVNFNYTDVKGTRPFVSYNINAEYKSRKVKL